MIEVLYGTISSRGDQAMTRRIVFETPGEIDVRAFTRFGVSAKPETRSPIGYFGTGLKYAIAVLCRHEIPVTIWIGKVPHVFNSKRETFRGAEFQGIRMKRQRRLSWSYEALPFTTQLGRNWELWQAFRELHSNTLDENGYTNERETGNMEFDARSGRTLIVVESNDFARCYDARDEIFHPRARREEAPGESIEWLHGESEHLYYRSLRVATMQRPSVVTWNLLCQTELTEDRTIKLQYVVDYQIARFIATSSDLILLEKVLAADEDTYEGRLDFEHLGVAPSPEFVRVAGRTGRRSHHALVMAFTPTDRKVSEDWRLRLRRALRMEDWEEAATVVEQHHYAVDAMLERDLERDPPVEREEDAVPF